MSLSDYVPPLVGAGGAGIIALSLVALRPVT
jgi:hypothetical protein